MVGETQSSEALGWMKNYMEEIQGVFREEIFIVILLQVKSLGIIWALFGKYDHGGLWSKIY